jgi:hypothetical protein
MGFVITSMAEMASMYVLDDAFGRMSSSTTHANTTLGPLLLAVNTTGFQSLHPRSISNS